jgi:hypothetical protein
MKIAEKDIYVGTVKWATAQNEKVQAEIERATERGEDE